MKKILLPFALLILSVALTGCGGGTGSAVTPAGVNTGVASVIKLMPVQSIVQTNSYLFLKAKVLDGNGNLMPNVPVTFTNLSLVGSLSATTVTTDRLGMATVSLYSTTSGFSTVQAAINSGAGQVRDKRTVFFSDYDITLPAPTPALTLEVDGNNNGIYNETSDTTLFQTSTDNQVLVRATVTYGGSPIAGDTVMFGADTAEASFPLGDSATTNDKGQASVLMQVDPSVLRQSTTVLNIWAYDLGYGAFNVLSLTLEPVTVGNIALYAAPQSVDSGGTSSITAVLQTTAGNAVPNGTTVNFSVGSGAITPFSQTTDGVAAATFTAPVLPADSSNQVVSVTASSGGRTGHVSVTVIAPVTSPTPTPTPAGLTVVPASVSVVGTTGGTATFTILNGTAPYIVTSADPLKAYNTTVGNGVWNVTNSGDTVDVTVPAGATTGSVTLTVTDSVGSTTTMSVSIVGSGLTVIPSTVSVDGTAGGTASFTISGGAPTYTVTSSDPLNAYNGSPGTGTWTGVNSGDTITVTVPAGAPAEAVTLTVTDSSAATKTMTLNIVTASPTPTPTPSPIQVVPASVGIAGAVGGTAHFTITGGTPPYVVTTSDPLYAYNGTPGTGVWDVTNSGDSIDVTVPVGAPAETATLTVTDTAAATQTMTVVISGSALPPIVVSPPSQSIFNPVASTSHVDYTISGGTGSYTATTDRPDLVSVTYPDATTVRITVDTVPLSTATVTITVLDSHGATGTATLELQIPVALAVDPTSASVQSGQSQTFTITGGVPPYSVSSNDTGTIASPGALAGDTFTVTPASVTGNTPVTLTVSDSDAHSVDVPVTVTPADLAIGLNYINVIGIANPDSSNSDNVTFTVTGGYPPYTVTSDHPSITPSGTWDLSSAPYQATTDVNNVTTETDVTFTVVDNAGSTPQHVVLHVFPQTTGLSISVDKPSVVGLTNPETNTADNITVYVSGGSPPYIVSAGANNTLFMPNGQWTLDSVPYQQVIDPDSVATTTTVTLTVTDNAGATATTTVTILP